MRVLPLAALAMFAASLVAPTTVAYAQPAFYFLKSGCQVEEINGFCPVPEVPALPLPPLPPLPITPPPIGVPKLVLADGILSPYDFLHPNAPNGTEPDLKPVVTGSETLSKVRFVTPGNYSHPNRIKGSILIGLWTGESAIPNGNLTATLYEQRPDGVEVPLVNGTVALDLNLSELPDPMSLVPPNTTDPMVIVFYEVAQVLPLILQPPNIFLLGPIDVTFDANSTLALGFSLTQGSSPLEEPPGLASIQFNGTLSPSFVYVPWYAPDPPKPVKPTSTGTRSTTPRPTSSLTKTTSGPGAGDGGKDGGHGLPGLEAPLILALVAVAAFMARRRL